ncbi:MAG: SDR family oxidoreductase [Aquimonas sp.]|nr:SDR family oxidoreductase [Aquimonas sp.]
MSKTVLITGAGSGLGRALAMRYAALGCRVGIADLDLERAEAVRAEIEATGGRAIAFHVDITSDEAWALLRDQISSTWHGLDVLINNAGVASGGATLEASIDDWRWMLDVNLLGVVRGCKAFAPGMLERGHGQIINIASFAGLAGAPGLSSYGVAKGGVVTLSEGLRGEFEPRGLRVSVVCPAFFKTNLLENFRGSERMRKTAAKLMEEARESADDIAQAIVQAAERGVFLIIPTATERRRWWLKRWFPEAYYKQVQKMVRSRLEKQP